MKREIKFRAWFPEQKEMHDWQKFDGAIIKNIFNQPDFCILQQFTGLKDKNGVEIYEGDICKTDNDSCDLRIIEDIRDLQYWGFMDDTPERFEVIGNIHENPDLL